MSKNSCPFFLLCSASTNGQDFFRTAQYLIRIRAKETQYFWRLTFVHNMSPAFTWFSWYITEWIDELDAEPAYLNTQTYCKQEKKLSNLVEYCNNQTQFLLSTSFLDDLFFMLKCIRMIHISVLCNFLPFSFSLFNFFSLYLFIFHFSPSFSSGHPPPLAFWTLYIPEKK